MGRKFRKLQCAAKSKRSGKQCQRWANLDSNVCYMHGAGKLKNPGGRPLETGLHSKVLKKKLSSKIQKHLDDPQLLDVRVNIAFKRVLLENLLAKRLSKGKKLNIATINNATEILTSISKDIERYEKISKGEQHTITINTLQQTMGVIIHVIDENITSEKDKKRIFNALAKYGLTEANIIQKD